MPTDFNMQDPATLEKIRRGPHDYVTGEGRHGTYVQRKSGNLHQEYPKIMDQTPVPKAADFKGKSDAGLLLDNAMKEWTELQKNSMVHNKSQEAAWLEQHAGDPVIAVVDRQYPKTMDRTPAPNPMEFNTLEELRAAREEHKQQIEASIVHDKDEEELWLREHSDNTEPKKKKARA